MAEKKEKKLSSFWDTGPGPAGVMLPPTIGYIDHDKTRHQGPAYSLGLKLDSGIIGKGVGPGPAYLIPKGLIAKGPDPNIWASIKSRTKLNEGSYLFTPGPAAYYPEFNLRNRAPAYSLAWRTKLIDKGNISPGPIYLLPPCIGPKIPDKMAAGEVSIKGRGGDHAVKSRSPGPIYDIGSPNLIKFKAGEVTVKGPWKPFKPSSFLAGPASYDLTPTVPKVYRQPPSFSLGIRHSAFTGVFKTDCDKGDCGPPNDDC